MNRITGWMTAALLLVGTVPATADIPVWSRADLAQLAAGGYNLYLRHARTDADRRDATPVDLNNCSTQRLLSAAGKSQAEDVGRALAAAGVDPAAVYVSPYCRCRETGEIAFGPERVQPEPLLAYSFRDPKPLRQKKAAWLKAQMGKMPPPGKVVVFVSHTSNLVDALGIWPDEEAEALVVRPVEGGGVKIVGRIPARAWNQP